LHKVFIKINPNNINEINQICELYVEAFNGAPFYENWNIQSAKKELENAFKKEGFLGYILLDNNKVKGLTWGYSFPQKNSERVNYEKISDNLSKRNLNFKKIFYLAEVAITEELRNLGIGTKLIEEQDKYLNNTDAIILRTKNPAMIQICNKIYGKELFWIKEESAYTDGKMYCFKR